MGRLKTESFEKAGKVELQSDVQSTLSPFEQRLSENLKRVVIKGKKGRGVPLLLTEEVNEAIQLILDTKEAVGAKESEYVFTNANGEPLRGCDCLKTFATSCGAKRPEVITSTNLRKHIATVSQVLNLRKNELDQLAEFLGHDIRVHREFYRLPETCTQVTKISKLLMAAEVGIEQHRGKNLDELDECVSHVCDQEVKSQVMMDEPVGDDPGQAVRESPVLGEESHRKREMGAQSDTPSPKRRKPVRRKWSSGEKAAVWRVCGEHIRRGEVPGISVCSRAIAEEPTLRGMAWRAIKYCCHNIIVGERRSSGCDAVPFE